jgi:Ca-activated chloride channel family protein
MIQFEHIDILYLLLLLPVFLIWFIFLEVQKKKRLKQFSDLELLDTLMPNNSKRRPRIKFTILSLAFVFIIIGLANPQIGSKLEEMKRKGVEIIVALDVSNSMLAEDIKPNRLDRAKRTVSQLIDKLHGDKVGLIVFAGKAYVQMPTTTDYRAAKMFLSSISPGIVPVQGTAVGEAIDLGLKSFTKDNEKNKVLLVITDGENHEDNAIKKAEEAASKGVNIFTIGMGLPKGTPIPVVDRLGRKDYRRDKNGEVVITKLNENFLQEIAATANGSYIPATRLDDLIDEFQKMDQQEFESKIYSDYEDRFQYFFGFAFILLLIEWIILSRKNKYLKHIKLFDSNNHLKSNNTKG